MCDKGFSIYKIFGTLPQLRELRPAISFCIIPDTLADNQTRDDFGSNMEPKYCGLSFGTTNTLSANKLPFFITVTRG